MVRRRAAGRRAPARRGSLLRPAGDARVQQRAAQAGGAHRRHSACCGRLCRPRRAAGGAHRTRHRSVLRRPRAVGGLRGVRLLRGQNARRCGHAAERRHPCGRGAPGVVLLRVEQAGARVPSAGCSRRDHGGTSSGTTRVRPTGTTPPDRRRCARCCRAGWART